MNDIIKLKELAKLIRYYCLVSTSAAGSGHPTSSLSATDLMTALFFGGFFRFDLKRPNYANNDRLIFSKGHASPLFYSLYAAAGVVTEKELLTLRKFGSALEGHPTPAFRYTEAATGSLGQGLSIGVGMALNARLDKLSYKTYVLLGDSEMAEGSQWEAIQIAAHYKLNNLIAVLDVNRLGQRGQTMYGHDVKAYEKRISSFGWKTIVINGHNLNEIMKAYELATSFFPPPSVPSHRWGRKGGGEDRPVMIIAKTMKGKGVTFIENKDGWHGKALSPEELKKALKELGPVNRKLTGELVKPEKAQILNSNLEIRNKFEALNYKKGQEVATRKAYGNALARIYPKYQGIVALDAEVSNSTFAEVFKEKYPARFFEMFIAEQNMASAALGFSRRGKIPFVSTFAAFFTRAFDQIRMSQYSGANIKFVGSHVGVSIGEDGASQMGLEDISMFRSILGSAVLYPSDAVSTEKLVEEMAKHKGISYLRTTRAATPVLYSANQQFPIGGSKVLRQSRKDVATVAAAGITLHEALAACEELKKQGILIRVIDLYSIKPIDKKTLARAAKETRSIFVVEDYYSEGGIGEAVRSALPRSNAPIISLAVRKMPRSGKPTELLDYEEISRGAIIKAVKKL